MTDWSPKHMRDLLRPPPHESKRGEPVNPAENAWEEWANSQAFNLSTNLSKDGFMAGYRRALEQVVEAAETGQITWGDGPQGYYGAMVDRVPLIEWLRNRTDNTTDRT